MGLWETVSGLPDSIVNSFLGAIKNMLFGFAQPLLDVARTLITSNIEPLHFQSLWLIFIGIINAFYLLLFVTIGLRFVVGSIDAVEREKAKEWLKKAFLLIITVNASLLIYSLILQASGAMTLYLWNAQFETLFTPSIDILGFLWVGLLAIFIFLTTITLVIRQIILILGVMLFPIGLFLYFIPPLQAYGSIILNILGVTIFMQVLDVIILIAVQAFAGEYATMTLMNTLAPAAAFLLIFIANILCLKIAIGKALGSAGVNVSIAGAAKAIYALGA